MKHERKLIFIGGSIGLLFPLVLLLISSFSILPEGIRGIFIIPLWFFLAGLSFTCPSTWTTGNIENPSNSCFAMMIVVGVSICFSLGALITVAVLRNKNSRKASLSP